MGAEMVKTTRRLLGAVLLGLAALAGCFGSDSEGDPDAGSSAGSGGSGGAGGSGAVSGNGAGGGSGVGAAGGVGGVGGASGSGGGGAGSGAAGGVGGMGGTIGVADGGTCIPCIGDTLTWGPNGGFVAFVDTSSLSDCNSYRHARQAAGDPGQPASIECERDMPCFGSGLHGVSDVLNSLAHDDVQDALKASPILFGTDPRVLDGQVFRFEVGGALVEVGGQCNGSAGCNSIPAGVQALVDLLRAIDGEQLALEPCTGKFD